MFVREAASEFERIDRWDGGFGWLAHPDEGGKRASHAIHTTEESPDGSGDLWLFDPLDAPGIDDYVDDHGTVAGVAVLSSYHARDAAAFADRYDVPVTVPAWVDRVEDRIDAPVERVDDSLAGFELLELRPVRAWRETVAYREHDGTLYVPDFLASEKFTVGDERIGMPVLSRLFPPRERFREFDPDRILLGHGAGIFDDAVGALTDTFDNARRRFPRALVTNTPTELRAVLSALR